MTYKNAKTILFAALIAAMILPFSGMMMAEAAPNENASDKAKDKFKKDKELFKKQLKEQNRSDKDKETLEKLGDIRT